MTAAPAPLLLSRRAAAKLLGISRNGSLSSLIARGVLTPVVVNGREWVSRAQLEEFARVGEKPASPTPRRRRTVGTGRIRDLAL